MLTAHVAHPELLRDSATAANFPRLPSGNSFARLDAWPTSNNASASVKPALRLFASASTNSSITVVGELVQTARHAGAVVSISFNHPVYRWHCTKSPHLGASLGLSRKPMAHSRSLRHLAGRRRSHCQPRRLPPCSPFP